MKNIVIFSGTTEGRKLSELFSAEGIKHTVCVAGDYGREVMNEGPFADIHVGRMDAEEMKTFLEKTAAGAECVVIDATHPYATEVTQNIKTAVDILGANYIRVKRDQNTELPASAKLYDDIGDCASHMDPTSGNILLTTGSKELKAYCGAVSKETKGRTYVRVLPSLESIGICDELGFEPDHVIAMQGPFGRGMNEALICEYDIRHLITKESGTAGGFEEKLEAAKNTGAQLHVIKRPSEEEGVSVSEAYRLVTGKEAGSGSREIQITIVGIGMGSTLGMTGEARDAIAQSEIVFGASRLLSNISAPHKYEMYRADEIIPVLEKEKPGKAAIVFSGDTGFFSGAKSMIRALGEWRSDAVIRVLPGISSISYLAAKLGESYEDAVLTSLHGRNTEKDIKALVDKIKHNEKVFALLSGAADIRAVAKLLTKSDVDSTQYVGANLSYPGESVFVLTPEEALSFDADGIVTAFFKNPAPAPNPLINIKRDEEFKRSDVPMTKECIRHESIIKLGLKEGDVFYDIGGGSGSIAIEAASLDPSLKVFTFERDPQASQLIRENISALGAHNVTLVEGAAEETLADMPCPDSVFIGGSGGKLREIVEILHSKGSGIRFVITAVSLETIEEVRVIIEKYEPADEEAMVLAVSDVLKRGSHHMLKGQNPIWIFSFTI
jgi:precorrin-6Y C5,15-methyltransferase (decarboxylating)